jgi:hypothetical protein
VRESEAAPYNHTILSSGMVWDFVLYMTETLHRQLLTCVVEHHVTRGELWLAALCGGQQARFQEGVTIALVVVRRDESCGEQRQRGLDAFLIGPQTGPSPEKMCVLALSASPNCKG